MYSEVYSFFEKVKDGLRNHDDYQAFLKCLHIYTTDIITRKELQSLVCKYMLFLFNVLNIGIQFNIWNFFFFFR